jgi:hypothetical protein
MRLKLRSHYGLTGLLVVLTLIVAAAVPAAAQPVATTSASLAKTVKKALGLSQAASKRSAKAIQIARSTQKQAGPQGVPGERGQIGPKGDAGLQGLPGVSGLQIASNQTAEDSTDSKSLTVDCPAGKKVFGGGASIAGSQDPNVGASVAIGSSGPFVDDINQVLPSETSWRVEAHEHAATAEGWQLAVYAICGNAI